ncbi:MAG: glycosyltransferase family 39 protein [Flavobacteriales bacterium]|nr:glycosyltransferase family 39 protein [Flavobacteriales bacterium]
MIRIPHTDRLWRIALIAMLLWGVGVRSHAVLKLKQGLSHDESVTYLCAAATEGAFQDRIEGLVDTLLRVNDVRSFYARPEHPMLRTVAADLALWDIHPPFYFWILHATHVTIGTGIIGGALLNVAAGMLLLVLLFLLARRALGSMNLALAACAIWYLSPAVVQIDLEARHYQFLALLATASFMISERMMDGRTTIGRWSLFTLVNALGLLTHYYYVFLLVPGTLFMLVRFRVSAPTLRYVGSLALSLVLFLVSFPEVFDFVGTYAARISTPEESTGFLDRAKTMIYASLAFFTEEHRARYVYSGVLVLAVVSTVALALWKGVRPLPNWSGTMGYFTITLIWAAGFTCAFYLVGISPAQAAGEQYFAYFWPLLAVLLVHVAGQAVPAPIRGWLFTAHMAQLSFAFHTSVHESAYLQNVLPVHWYQRMGSSDLVIMDDHKRSNLPRIAQHLPPSLPLYLMKNVSPDLTGMDEVAVLHLAIGSRPPASELLDRVEAQGFHRDGNVQRHDHFELHHFRR